MALAVVAGAVVASADTAVANAVDSHDDLSVDANESDSGDNDFVVAGYVFGDKLAADL